MAAQNQPSRSPNGSQGDLLPATVSPNEGRRNSGSSTSSDATATARASFDSQAQADDIQGDGSALQPPSSANLGNMAALLPGYDEAQALVVVDASLFHQAPAIPRHQPKAASNSAKRKSPAGKSLAILVRL